MSQIQYILQDIKEREIVLPEFQREFEWGLDQTKNLLDSLLKDYPTGSLLMWGTSNPPALKNYSEPAKNQKLDVLLDGQQRLTALYLLMKDAVPPYYKSIDSSKDPRKLFYNLKTKKLKYYSKLEMQNNPFWVSVVDCYKDEVNVKNVLNKYKEQQKKETDEKENALIEDTDLLNLMSRLGDNFKQLKDLIKYDYPIMRVNTDASLRDALKVFDRVNTGGTPLSESDVALAYMCSEWGEMRRKLKGKIIELEKRGFKFDLKFMIRAMNAVINTHAYYEKLHNLSEKELKAGWEELDNILDYLINILPEQAYIYSVDDLNSPSVLIPLIGYLARNGGRFKEKSNLNKFIYWIYAALYMRRYSASTDQKLEKDLAQLKPLNPIDNLIQVLKQDEGDLEVNTADLKHTGVGHPFYNMMVFMIRAKGAVDWKNNISLNKPYGDKFKIQRHHIFPKTYLRDNGYDTGADRETFNKVHEIANRIPLTREGNVEIFNKAPQKYLSEVEENNPGNLEKSLIPTDSKLWKAKNYELFLKKRRQLIVEAINDHMAKLLANDKSKKKISVQDIIANGETQYTEFKSSIRWSYQRNQVDKDLEVVIAKVISSFMNSEGGKLLIGVDDDGNILGLQKDYSTLGNKQNSDGFLLKIDNIVKNYLGNEFSLNIKAKIEKIEGKDICIIDVMDSSEPVYLNVNNETKFYIRSSASTQPLDISAATRYIKNHWD